MTPTHFIYFSPPHTSGVSRTPSRRVPWQDNQLDPRLLRQQQQGAWLIVPCFGASVCVPSLVVVGCFAGGSVVSLTVVRNNRTWKFSELRFLQVHIDITILLSIAR